MAEIKRKCTACGIVGGAHSIHSAHTNGTVQWAGVVAHIRKGEPLCTACNARLINWKEA